MAEAAPAALQPEGGRSLGAEALGAGVLAFVIIAAGILGERHAGGNNAVVMLSTCLAGAAAFVALAHALSGVAVTAFNPAVALAMLLAGRLALVPATLTALAQIVGAFLGAMVAHIVTNMGTVQVASQIQTGVGVWTGEFIAAALFSFVILSCNGRAPFAAAACLLAASLATPSLSFANPAVTFARTLTDSFTAIRLEDAALIAVLQFAGAIAAYALLLMLRSCHAHRKA